MNQYTASTTEIIKERQTKIIPEFNSDSIISIFKNNELQTEEDYLVENGKIVFANVSEGDVIKVNHDISTSKKLISPGKTRNGLLTRYNSDIKLNENNKYTVNIEIDGDEYRWTFNSRQNPMFTSYKKILEDVGEFLEGFTEEYINNKIYDNSVAVIDLIDELASQEDPITNVTYDKDDDGFYTSKYKAVSNWVRFKTDIDLVMARYFGISYRYGSESKEIGDIKIEKSTKLPYIDNLLDRLKKDFQLADEAIRGVNFVASAVKAGTQYKYDDWDRDTTW